MLGELVLLTEAVPAEPALEGFGPRMRPVVGLPVPLQGEGLVAVRALVGLLAVVDLLVDDEAHQGRVGLPALPALVGFLSSVGSPVSLQVRLLVETFLTLRAVDHLSARVGRVVLPRSLATELRVIVCRDGEVRGQVKGGYKWLDVTL